MKKNDLSMSLLTILHKMNDHILEAVKQNVTEEGAQAVDELRHMLANPDDTLEYDEYCNQLVVTISKTTRGSAHVELSENLELFLIMTGNLMCIDDGDSYNDSEIDASYTDCCASLHVLSCFGISTHFDMYNHVYDGDAQSIEVTGKDIYNLLHEFGLWICSNDDERCMDNFGMDPEDQDIYREIAASVVALYVIWHLNTFHNSKINIHKACLMIGADSTLSQVCIDDSILAKYNLVMYTDLISDFVREFMQ